MNEFSMVGGLTGMAVQPNSHSLGILRETLVSGDRESTSKKLYEMRQDHLDLIDGLRGSRTRVAMLRAIIDDWRTLKIDQLSEELESERVVA